MEPKAEESAEETIVIDDEVCTIACHLLLRLHLQHSINVCDLQVATSSREAESTKKRALPETDSPLPQKKSAIHPVTPLAGTAAPTSTRRSLPPPANRFVVPAAAAALQVHALSMSSCAAMQCSNMHACLLLFHDQVLLQAAMSTALPDTSVPKPPPALDLAEAYREIMRLHFCADRGAAAKYNRIMELQHKVLAWTDRVQAETEDEFATFLRGKLVAAETNLKDEQAMFESEIASDIHDKFCAISASIGGPEFDLWSVGQDGSV